ncbi:putative late blight resistance protein homolog R1A-3 [Camellia sinensis]|uniref:putative late blight resistance protein homolog R1A-3 n=1 Tax=Camellia sinensis TaxID=4442 RepID=UPI001036DB18|nr:putative late blight resistance protein homolog R1A-3 [Camellia sinensis]
MRRLLQLWVAEGFVQTPNRPSIDSKDMAMTCLEELERRNMVEIAERKSDGSPKTCRMSCFLYNIFLPKAEDIGFLHVHRLNSDCTLANSHIIRRIADQFLGVKSTSESHTRNLCSYVSFEAQKRVTSNTKIANLLNSLVNKGKSFVPLKVLDLEGVYKPWLPKKLSQCLKNLRYVGLRWTGLYTCPDSIGDLQSLETLDLKYTNITALPSSIWKAKSLRHLYMTGVSIRKPSLKESLTSTSKLETLTGLVIGSKEASDEENDNYCLDWFTGLKKLGLTCHSKSVEKTVKCMSRLDKLETLKLRSRDLPFGQPSDLVLSPLKDHQTLSKLHLFGLIKHGIHNLPLNLKILTLSMS